MGKFSRKVARNNKPKVDTLPARMLVQNMEQKAYDDGFRDGLRHSYKTLLTIMAYITMNEFNLTDEQLQKYFIRCMNTIDCFRTKHLVPDDIDLMLDELKERGIDIGKIDKGE